MEKRNAEASFIGRNTVIPSQRDNAMHNFPFIHSAIERNPSLSLLRQHLADSVGMLADSIRSGGKILLCGNGGSAADAEHIVGELMKSFLAPRLLLPEQRQLLETAFPSYGPRLASMLQRAVPAISLVSNVSFSTAFSNDVAQEYVFAQQVFGLAKEGDVLWGLSTSGNSQNIVHAFRVARAFKVKTLGFTGRDGGEMAALCDIEIRVPLSDTPLIQELHLPLYHALCAELEAVLFGFNKETASND